MVEKFMLEKSSCLKSSCLKKVHGRKVHVSGVEKSRVEMSCNILPALMAFAFTFHLLLPSNETFADPVTALLKVLAMMVGEFDFQTNFLIEKSALDNGQVSTQIVFFFFLLIGNIVIFLSKAISTSSMLN